MTKKQKITIGPLMPSYPWFRAEPTYYTSQSGQQVMCHAWLRNRFHLPASVTRIWLTISRRPSQEAVEVMLTRKSSLGCGRWVLWSDHSDSGRRRLGSMYVPLETRLKRNGMAEGTVYVSVEYEEST